MNTMALNGVVSGPGRLIKADAGELLLGVANTHGGTVLNAGTLVLGSAGALSASALEVGGSARLDATKTLTVANAITLNGELTTASLNDLTLLGPISGGGALALRGAQRTLTLTGTNSYTNGTRLGGGTLASIGGARSVRNALVLGDTLTLTSSDDFTLTGIVSGDGALLKESHNNSTLTLAGANTYAGGTTVNGGYLALGVNSTPGAASSLGTGALTTNGNVGLSSVQAALVLDNAITTNGILSLGIRQDSTLNGEISGSGSLAMTNSNVALNGNNTYTGGTLLHGGRLTAGRTGALGGGALTVVDAATLASTGSVMLDNDIRMDSGLRVDAPSGDEIILAGDISGAAALTKIGDGILTLEGANSYGTGTTLLAGTLRISNSLSLGSGALAVNGIATLGATQALMLNNDIDLAGGSALTLDGGPTMTLTSVITGAGGLVKNIGETVLTGASTYTGDTALNGGILDVRNNSALGAVGSVVVANGGTLASAGEVALENAFNLISNLTVASADTLTLSGGLGGAGGLVKQDSGTLALTGANAFGGDIAINNGTVIGNTASLPSNVSTVAGTRIVFDQADDAIYGGVLSGAGTFDKQGLGTLTLGNTNTLIGEIGVSAGALTINDSLTLSNASDLRIDTNAVLNVAANADIGSLSGAGQLNLVGSGTTFTYSKNDNAIFEGMLGGAGTFAKAGTGSFTLASGGVYTGLIAVNQGAVQLDGAFGSTVAVARGATLTGNGSVVGATTIADGGILALNASRGPFTAGLLTLNNSSIINAQFGGAGAGALADVTGDLKLGGMVNISDTSGLGVGSYRLFNYGGMQTGLLALGTLPSNVLPGNVVIQTAIAGQINVVNQNISGQVQFWDPRMGLTSGDPVPAPDNQITGGAGVWNSATANFTNINGASGDIWGGRYAVFAKPASSTADAPIVTIEGLQPVAGLHFSGADYILNAGADGGAIDAVSDTDGLLTVRVDNGLTTVINAPLTGAATLAKRDEGMLILGGANTYTGGTQIDNGTLRITQDDNLGVLTSDVMLGAATLQVADTITTTRNIALAGDGIIDVLNNQADPANPVDYRYEVNGVISGAGAFTKLGAGTLAVQRSNNTYTGGTTLQGGTLAIDGAQALGSGAVVAVGGSTLRSDSIASLRNAITLTGPVTVDTRSQPGGLMLTGVVDGTTGSLIKIGNAALTLTGDNSYSGDTQLRAGTIAVGSDNALGTGVLTAAGGSALIALGDHTLSNVITLVAGTPTAGLTVDTTGATLSLVRPITGSQDLNKVGGGMLVLAGVNTLSGPTLVDAGTLQVNGSLATAGVNVNNAGVLAGAGTVVGDVTLANNGRLVADTVAQHLTIDGALTLDDTSQLDISLGTPNTSKTAVIVTGDLALNGVLNVANAGGLGTGVYQLMSYDGALTDKGLAYGTLPANYTQDNFNLQTNLGQSVNLVVESTVDDVRFWNGAKAVADGTISGGAGAWSASGTNWTNASGTDTRSWNARFAIFGATGGTVTVEGTQSLTGLQFLSDGYQLTSGMAGELAISAPNTVFRVADGARANLNLPITGGGGLELSQDGGTLALGGTNVYSGGSTVRAGTVEVTRDGNLGAINSGVLLAGGGLRVVGTEYGGTGRVITLAEPDGTIEIADADHTFTLAGSNHLTGTGGLVGRRRHFGTDRRKRLCRRYNTECRWPGLGQ